MCILLPIFEFKKEISGNMARCFALILALFTALAAAGQEDVQTIIQRSVQANNKDWQAAPAYSYFERDVQGGGTRTSEVTMILDSPYARLVAVNGKPLTPGEQAKEQQKLEKVTAQRCGESKQERGERIAKYEKERSRDHLLMDEMTKAFNFKLVGEQRSGPFDVYETSSSYTGKGAGARVVRCKIVRHKLCASASVSKKPTQNRL